ncbi:hypothetical protein PRIC1_007207 [Phytophthora ramorum]
MEWNNLRPYHSNQSTFTQQPHGSAQPWYYDEEEDQGVPEFRRSSTTLQADRYAGRSGLAPPPVIPSLKVESASSGGGSAALQSLSSLSMPQLEESTEFQSFFSPPGGRFADSTYLSENQPPQLQQQEQQGEQLPSQFSGQFTPFPSAMATYYPPLTPAPTPMLSAARPSMDYYSEGIATLPSTHCPVPTLPSTFGSLQRQQQLSQTILEDRCENFDNSNASGIGPIGDSFLTERNPSPPPSAPDSSSPSLQFFSDNVPV